MSVVEDARRLAEELKLLGRNVFFHEQWVPYDERESFLLEADLGISAHPDTIDSRFAFRTRVLDHIWAGLPMILSAGDDFSDWAERNSVGRSVAPSDVGGWKEAILFWINDAADIAGRQDRKSTRLNSSHRCISYAVFCLKKKKNTHIL